MRGKYRNRKKIHWKDLQLIDVTSGFSCLSYGGSDYVKARFVKVLSEWKARGCLQDIFFETIGRDHEDPEDSSTWGPKCPARVDWTGFEDEGGQ
jgi:hypothetical protein